MTKKQEWMLDKYNASSASELRQVYYSWSDKKEEAYKKCRMKQTDHNGITAMMAELQASLRINSHSALDTKTNWVRNTCITSQKVRIQTL